jgi:hypothetical protein
MGPGVGVLCTSVLTQRALKERKASSKQGSFLRVSCLFFFFGLEADFSEGFSMGRETELLVEMEKMMAIRLLGQK